MLEYFIIDHQIRKQITELGSITTEVRNSRLSQEAEFSESFIPGLWPIIIQACLLAPASLNSQLLFLRVSKSGRHADARLRIIFHKLRKILDFECKTVKITSFNLIFTDFDSLFLCIMFFPAHFHAQIFFCQTFCLRNTHRF